VLPDGSIMDSLQMRTTDCSRRAWRASENKDVFKRLFTSEWSGAKIAIVDVVAGRRTVFNM